MPDETDVDKRATAALDKIGRILVEEAPHDLIGPILARLCAAWIKGHAPPIHELAAEQYLIAHIRHCILYWEEQDKESA